MFNITDNEKLRDAYALLMFMQNDISASSKKRGSFDVEADNLGEAYQKAGENPGKYADLKVWNDGAEAQLRTYSHINCIGEYDVDDAVAALTGKGAKKE